MRVYLDNEQGDEITLLSLGPGDSFGELALLSGKPRAANVITTADSELAVIPRQGFLECVRQHPEIALRLIEMLVDKLQGLTDDMSSIALLDVYGRVVKAVMKHAREQDGELITEKMTHQELANLVGASREMVSRILKDLRAGGYITIRDKRIVVERTPPSAW